MGSTSISPDVRSWFSYDGNEDICDLSCDGNVFMTRGAFGDISVGLRAGDGGNKWEPIVFKTIADATVVMDDSSLRLRREVFNEICALRVLGRHPNIVSLVSVRPQSPRGVTLVLPYLPIDLHASMKWRENQSLPLLPFEMICVLARDILSALAHCHANSIIHRDIKPGNILLSSDGVAKLCDFGLAKPFESESSKSIEANKTSEAPSSMTTAMYKAPMSKGMCTLFYRPPEALLGGSSCIPASDMFSFGLLIGEMIDGSPMFPGSNVLDQLARQFTLLGSPTQETWLDVHKLPDYGKLSFKKKVPIDWKWMHPRIVENSTLYRIVKNTVKLDPHQRWLADDVLRQLKSTVDEAELRSRISNDLIPRDIHNPIVSGIAQDQSLASKLAIQLAALRRSVLETGATNMNDDALLDCRNIDKLCERLRV